MLIHGYCSGDYNTFLGYAILNHWNFKKSVYDVKEILNNEHFSKNQHPQTLSACPFLKFHFDKLNCFRFSSLLLYRFYI